MAPAKKEKETGPDYVATRTETFTVGEQRYELVVGQVYSNLPEELVANLTGDYGGLEMVEPGTLEVQTDDGAWVIAPEEEA